MARFSLGSMAREEEGTAGDIPEGAGEAVLAEITESPAEDIGQAQQLVTELDEISGVIDGATGDADALDDVAESIQDSAATGGLDAPAAEAIAILVGRLAKRHEMPVHTGGRAFSTESFGDTRTRRTATESALETVKDFGKKIWEWLKIAYTKAKEWVLKWWKNFFDGATKLKNRGEKLKKIAENKTGDIAAGAKVNNDKVAEELRDGGQVITAAKLVSALETVKSQAAAGRASTIATALGDAVEKIVGADASAAKTALTEAHGRVLDKPSTITKSVAFDAGEGLETVPVAEWIGGTYTVLTYKKGTGDANAKTDEALADELGSARIKVMLPKDHKPMLKTEMEAANKATAMAICDKVIAIAGELTKSEASVKELVKKCDQAISYAKKAAGQTKDDGEKKKAGIARKVAQASLSSCTSGFSADRQVALSKANYALQFAAASINEIGKKSESSSTSGDAGAGEGAAGAGEGAGKGKGKGK